MKNIYNNIKINYAFWFVKSLNATNGIWMLYLASKGLTLFEIGLIEAIFHITSLIMETPTGAIADIFGRKTSRIIGIVLGVLSNILMITSNSFGLFALGFVFCALSFNFESGAGEAMIYDTLKSVDKQDKFMKITGNNEVIYQTTQIIALVIGGLLGNHQFVYVYYMAIVLAVITFIIALFFKEPKIDTIDEKKEKISFVRAIKKQYIDSFNAVKGNRKLLYLILLTTVFLASLTLSFFYIQIAFKDIGLSIFQIGVYLAISAVAAALGALFAEKIEKKMGEYTILKIVPIIMALMILLFYFVRFALIPLIILSFVEAILYVATRDYINQHIASDKRATILSFDSMMFSFFMIASFPLFGWVSDHIGLQTSFLIFGGIILIVALLNLGLKITKD
ncbi:MAG: MFS transporter [Clostridiales bacterium]|nr:MFS transporter [Clostridiales bacterium]